MSEHQDDLPRGRRLTRALSTFATLSLLYVGLYFLLVTTDEGRININSGRNHRVARYRVGDKVAAAIFAPIHQLDRKLRPDTWTPKVPWPVDLESSEEVGQLQSEN